MLHIVALTMHQCGIMLQHVEYLGINYVSMWYNAT